MRQTRREFLRNASLATAAFGFGRRALAAEPEIASFFLVGDTHYCAMKEDISKMSESTGSTSCRDRSGRRRRVAVRCPRSLA
jgi:hypothetical protein